VRIAVGPDGAPWIVDFFHRVARAVDGAWAALPPLPGAAVRPAGAAVDIGAGSGGTCWVGTATGVHFWDGDRWTSVEGSAVALSVDRDDRPWIVSPRQEIAVRT
jgi:hypothetical protein